MVTSGRACLEAPRRSLRLPTGGDFTHKSLPFEEENYVINFSNNNNNNNKSNSTNGNKVTSLNLFIFDYIHVCYVR
uniref:Uncharacterized protein n=1 Tax=Vespula pensylvanica TaxID=30213 RepID=A0A834PA18_VESPE|nr:hypothetical protein H0235_002394 [Vespula pensylvanica]